MAVTASGLFYLTFRDILQNDTAVDLLADTIKAALFTDTITPNFDTNTAYAAAPYNANEVGTPSGGVALTTPAISVSSGTLRFGAANTPWASQTFSNAECALLYDDTITTPTADPALVLVDFGSPFSVTSGVFTIQWTGGIVFTIDLTP
jgi:hypothetical protein